MKVTFTVRITVDGDDPKAALEDLQSILDESCVKGYTTDTYTDENGEEVDTATLM